MGLVPAASAGWSEVQQVGNSLSLPYLLSSGIDDSGNAIVVWEQQSSEGFSALMNQYDPLTGWSGVVVLRAPSADYIFPSLAMAATGEAVVSWFDGSANPPTLFAKRYSPSAGWSFSEQLWNPLCGTMASEVGIDNAGNITIAWTEGVCPPNKLILGIRRFAAAEGRWLSPAWLTDATENVDSFSLSVAPSGLAAVAWTATNGSNASVSAAYFEPSAPWPSHVAQALGGVRPLLVKVAASDMGDLATSWVERPGIRSGLGHARFSPGSGWDNSTVIDDGEGNILWTNVVLDSAGNLMLSWGQDLNASITNQTTLLARRALAGAGWEGQNTVLSSGGDANSGSIAADGLGGLMAIWPECSGGHLTFQTRRWTPSRAWAPPVPLKPPGTDSSCSITAYSSISLSAGGKGVALWLEETLNNQSFTLLPFAALYEPDTFPPLITILSPTEPLLGDGRVTISGLTEPAATVEVLGVAVPVNNSSGFFETQFVFPDGGWGIAVNASDQEGNLGHATVIFRIDTQPPPLSITGPANGTVLYYPTASVEGDTEPGVLVGVDDVAIVSNAAGHYQLIVQLLPGPNLVVVAATDPAGNRNETSIVVVFADMWSQLTAQLFAVEQDIGQLAAHITNVSNEIAQGQSTLDMIGDELGQAAQELDRLDVTLRTLETALGQNSSRVQNASLAIGQVRTELLAVRQALDAATARLDAAESELAARQSETARANQAAQLAMALATAALFVTGLLLAERVVERIRHRTHAIEPGSGGTDEDARNRD